MTLDELTTPLTPDEVQTAIYAAIAARGGDPTSWKPGAPTRTMIAGVAIVISALSRLSAAITKSGFLELADDDWLTLVARYVFFVERIEGTFASGSVTLNNAGGGIYSFDPGDLIVLNTTSGKGYRNTTTFTINALQLGVAVPVEAVELGSESTSLAGEIDGFETPLPGLSVTNAAALIGTDPEKDPALRQRCLEKPSSLSPNGPRSAYAYFAKNAKKSDGFSAGVTRVRTVADGYGNVTVYCATASGSLTGTVGDTSTALGAVDDAIQKNVVPEAVTATCTSATPVAVGITYEVWVRDTSGKSDVDIEDVVNDALTAFISTQPIGGHKIPLEPTGRLYKTAIESTIDAALKTIGGDDPDFVIKRVVTAPAGDTDLAINEAPTLGPINGTIHQVSESSIA